MKSIIAYPEAKSYERFSDPYAVVGERIQVCQLRWRRNCASSEIPRPCYSWNSSQRSLSRRTCSTLYCYPRLPSRIHRPRLRRIDRPLCRIYHPRIHIVLCNLAVRMKEEISFQQLDSKTSSFASIFNLRRAKVLSSAAFYNQ